MDNIKRDYQLDTYRGLSIIYVVCVIHVLYWLGIGQEPLISLILFEMPVIFFVSGASLSFHRKPRPVISTIKSRFYRVLLPYYIYAVAMVLVVTFLSLINSWNCDISQYTRADVWQILSATDIPQSPFSWHLWFILPYLILSCTFDIQKRILLKVNPGGYLLACVILFIVVNTFPISDIIRNVCFYNIFMVMGYCYYKHCKKYLIICAMILSLISVLVMTVGYNVKFCPMQLHKFPPDIMFLVYSVFAVCLLSLIFSKVKIPKTKIFDIWIERGYTIYLYQNIVFFFVNVIYIIVISKIPNGIIQGFVCSVLVFVISSLLSSFTYKIENIIVDKIRVLSKKSDMQV